MQYDLTILVALYNSSKYLNNKLNNLINQSIFDKCLIVLLNCQNISDERKIYLDYIKKYSNIVEIYFHQYHRLYYTWNEGIKNTKTEFICNSNSDDVSHPDFAKECVNWLKDNKDYGCVSTRIACTRIPNQTYPDWQWDYLYPKSTYPFSTAGPSPVWRRSLHVKYGLFKDYRVIGDADMWNQWHKNGVKFGVIDKIMTLYYANDGSLERRSEGSNKLWDLDMQDAKSKALTREKYTG